MRRFCGTFFVSPSGDSTAYVCNKSNCNCDPSKALFQFSLALKNWAFPSSFSEETPSPRRHGVCPFQNQLKKS